MILIIRNLNLIRIQSWTYLQALWLQFNATTEFYTEHVTSNFVEWLTFFLLALFFVSLLQGLSEDFNQFYRTVYHFDLKRIYNNLHL